MHKAGPVMYMDFSLSNPKQSEGHRQGQTETETDRQTGRQRDRQAATHRQTEQKKVACLKKRSPPAWGPKILVLLLLINLGEAEPIFFI